MVEEFDDSLTARIGGDQQSDSAFWQISVNGQPIEVGGCQHALESGDDVTFEYVLALFGKCVLAAPGAAVGPGWWADGSSCPEGAARVRCAAL